MFVSPVSERESAAFVFILYTCDDSRGHILFEVRARGLLETIQRLLIKTPR